MSGNPHIVELGKKTRFDGIAAVENGKKGAAKTNAIRRQKKEALNVFQGAKDNTTQAELMEAFQTIKRFAKRGSLPHWEEWLRLTGQSEASMSNEKTTFTDDTEIDRYAD